MPISDSTRPSAPVVGYDRVTSVPLCEHGDDAEACQLRHKSPVDPAPIERIEDIPAELRDLFITHVKAARHVADGDIKLLYRRLGDLQRRLNTAERVCYLVGISAARRETDRDKAVTQAWLEWSHDYQRLVTPVSDEEITQLATRRDEITQQTLARLRRESAEEQEQQRHLDFLECLYIEQCGPDTRPNPSGGES